jgi:hypothetical protein
MLLQALLEKPRECGVTLNTVHHGSGQKDMEFQLLCEFSGTRHLYFHDKIIEYVFFEIPFLL